VRKLPNTFGRNDVEDEPLRSRIARAAAERALVRVVHHYGQRPEFVLIGGLVPELLCADSPLVHAGTTDVDVQVNLEIAAGAINTARLEQALRNAEFEPDSERIWRWRADGHESGALVKFELLADLDNVRAGADVVFDECERLGATNLRGTGFAARDVQIQNLRARVGGVLHEAEIYVTGLAGFLLAKTAAAHSRRKPKDWYDITFVLLHNDAGGPEEAAEAVLANFTADIGRITTALDDLCDNFADIQAQGPHAFADQMLVDHPDLDRSQLLADAVVAVHTFHARLTAEAS
jgi:hypothetical protein